MADAQASGACGSNIVWVQVPSPAFFITASQEPSQNDTSLQYIVYITTCCGLYIVSVVVLQQLFCFIENCFAVLLKGFAAGKIIFQGGHPMYSKKQRMMAWVGIALLLLLYIITFVLGVFGSKQTFPMLMASLLATFFIPTMIYVFQLLLKNARDKRITGDAEEMAADDAEEVTADGAEKMAADGAEEVTADGPKEKETTGSYK